MSVLGSPWVVFGLVVFVLVFWLVVLTAALVAERRRHDRLTFRVSSLSKSVTRISRLRTKPVTGEQVVTRLSEIRRPPPFPVPPPRTNPMVSARGKHTAT